MSVGFWCLPAHSAQALAASQGNSLRASQFPNKPEQEISTLFDTL